MIHEPKIRLDARSWVIKILDAHYEKADLKAMVGENCAHLSVPEKKKLLGLLTEFEELFDGTLGDWNCNPVSLQLKVGAQPFHGRPFPTPKSMWKP